MHTGAGRLGAAPIALIGVALLLAGCAAPQTAGLERDPPADLPPRAELDTVPFHPQERWQCGPAALATVLPPTARASAPSDLVDEVYVPTRKGTLRSEMRAAARARGLVPYPLAPQLTDLLREIASGRPVLVMQNLGLDWFPRWHYAVAVGYDLAEEKLILRSGTTRRRITAFSAFERTWARGDRWAQVVVPPDEPPATATPLEWLRAVRELETTGRLEAARQGFGAATDRWPRETAAWMARGNAAFADDDPGGARDAFLEAIELAPRGAAGWNNLAYALAATGDQANAIAAARCATRLAPEAKGPRDTLREIEAGNQNDPESSADLPECLAPQVRVGN
ncbi:MAG: PA2778 family cysteine peptidase [Halofilum sp. (in: g-proteobacteria)]